jgi:hypothetical protein
MGGFGSGRFGRRSSRSRVQEVHEVAATRVHPERMRSRDVTQVATVSLGNATAELRFVTTTQPFGGLRWWFLCPRCATRRAKLYVRLGGRHFACRECHRLRYTSQCLSMPERWRYRADVFLRRAGCHSSDSFYDKPKWMRWATFNEIIDRAEEFDAAHCGYGLRRFIRHGDLS